MFAGRHDSIVYRIGIVCQVGGKTTRIGKTEIGCQLGFANVETHQDHFLLNQGKRHGQVGGYVGFTFAINT